MLKINTYSQGLMALKQMVVSQSSVVKGHTERLGLSFAISVMAATGAILGSPIEAAATECTHSCPHLPPPEDKCKKTCEAHESCWGTCRNDECTITCIA